MSEAREESRTFFRAILDGLRSESAAGRLREELERLWQIEDKHLENEAEDA